MKKFLSLMALFTATVIMSSCRSPNMPAQPSLPTLPPANVTCNEFSFYLDPNVGNGFECQTIPENSSSDIPQYIFIYPTHTELTIQNYPLTHTQFPPRIWIYPVSRFNELLPDFFPQRLSDLNRLLSSGTWSSGDLPFLPPIPETQSFFCHKAVISFYDGHGVRFLTEYSEGLDPISNLNVIYTFQGLTADGKYWVAVTLPISSPILPANYDTLPNGYTEESLILNYNAYVQDVKDALEAQEPASFSPTISSLDILVESIFIRQ